MRCPPGAPRSTPFMSLDSMAEQDELSVLRAENARLIALLDSHGIDWRQPSTCSPPIAEPSRLSTDEKVALFRNLFHGRLDVYPVRWESKTTGKSGYMPACANEWRAGICEKPRIKCGDCDNRLLIPVSEAVIYKHLAGQHTVGVYPLLEDDSCHFLAVDFDEAEWRDDARAFMQSCTELGVPAALEISRSGQGAHAWVFFASRVSARDARRDERFDGQPLDVSFVGNLRVDQEAAIAAMLPNDAGVLCAPTAFGKTVTAAAMIARRGVNTLVLVHRTELLKQWQEQLQAFLGVGKGVVGTIGGGQAKPTGKVDIAVMQSLSRQGEVHPLVENYGRVSGDPSFPRWQWSAELRADDAAALAGGLRLGALQLAGKRDRAEQGSG